MRPSHVPASYAPSPLRHATLWSVAPEPEVGRWVEDALERVQSCLQYRLGRALHVVVYPGVRESRAALDRDVPVTMLLAPLHQPDHALVALHSPDSDPANRDPGRMLRHLCHELAHVCTSEVTGSYKRLGDGDVDLKVEPWVDEGIAVCVAAVAAGQPERLEQAAKAMTADEMNAAFRDLRSPQRPAAFASATSTVWRAAQRLTLPRVFREAARPSSWMQ